MCSPAPFVELRLIRLTRTGEDTFRRDDLEVRLVKLITPGG